MPNHLNDAVDVASATEVHSSPVSSKPTILLFQIILFLIAFVQFAIGPSVPAIAVKFSVPETDLGIAFAFQFSGGLIMLLLGGRLVRTLGYRTNLVIAVIMFVIGISIVPVTSNVAELCAVLFLLMAGSAHAQVVIFALVDILYKKESVKYQSLVGATFALGAVTGPLYAGVTMGPIGWGTVFWTGAVLFVPAFVWLLRSSVRVDAADVEGNGDGSSALRGRFIVLTLALILYVGGEAVINSWVSTFFQETLSASSVWQGFSLSAYWIGMVLGRLIVGTQASRYKPQTFIYLGAPAGAILIALGAMADGPVLSTIYLSLAGWVTGGVFPSITALLGAQPGGTRLFHLFFALGQSGPVVFPYVAGRIADAWDFRNALMLPVPAFIILTVAVMVFSSMTKLRDDGNV